jgi:hypothetical protein
MVKSGFYFFLIFLFMVVINVLSQYKLVAISHLDLQFFKKC